MTEYQERIERELQGFSELEDVHGLPPIFPYWSDRHFLPLLHEVGHDSLAGWWDDEVAARCAARAPAAARLVSLGAGNGDLEIELAARLAERGVENLEVVLLELNPAMLERASAHADRLGLASRVRTVTVDLNSWTAEEPADVYLAHHSLHHVVELEHLLDQVAATLADGGVLLVNDMVGRNGHRRWPEALALVEEIWRAVPPRYRVNALTGLEDRDYPDLDCSTEGFEGVRAQDILALLLERFHPEVYLTFSNVIDPFIDRVYGPNLDPDSSDDRRFIDAVATLDDAALDLGLLTPTHLVATFRSEPVDCRYPRGRSPARPVRRSADPPFDRAPAEVAPALREELGACTRAIAALQEELAAAADAQRLADRELTVARTRYDTLRARKVVRLGLALAALRKRARRTRPAVGGAGAVDAPDELAGLLDEPWMYEFDLGGGLRTTAFNEELLEVHSTRAAVAEPVARAAFAAADGPACAIDLACSEGWFSQRLLEWGADKVTGVDIRPENIRRATLVRDRLGIGSDRFALRTSDVFDLDPAQLGTFDVVLCFGLIYHLENPIGALRIARAMTRGVCIVESQLTEQVEPLRHGWGTTGQFLEQPASWAAYFEPPQLQESHPVAAYGGVVSFIPNRAALLEAMTAAGFSRVEPLVPTTGNPQYVEGNRLVVAGWP